MFRLLSWDCLFDDWMEAHLMQCIRGGGGADPLRCTCLSCWKIINYGIQTSGDPAGRTDTTYKTAFNSLACSRCFPWCLGTSRSGATILGAMILGCSRPRGSRVFLFPGNSGDVRRQSVKAGEVRLPLYRAGAVLPDRRYGDRICSVGVLHQIPDGLHQKE